jgi:hypothetical protein
MNENESGSEIFDDDMMGLCPSKEGNSTTRALQERDMGIKHLPL